MASGNTLALLNAWESAGPATSFATRDTITGAATPAEAVEVLDFDAATDEYADFYCVLPQHYAGGGLTLRFAHSASSATSGTVRVGAAIRAIPDDTEDLDTTSYDYVSNANTAGFTVPSAVGEVAYDTITFTSGADMDSLAAGERFVLRVFRDGDGTSGTDDATGDWELHSVEIRET